MIRGGAILLAVLGLAGCEGLPETGAGVTRPVSYDGVSYMVDFAVREVTEQIPAPGGGTTEARFDASIIDITRADSAPLDDIGSADAIAIASAFCKTYGLPQAPVAGRVSRVSGQWRVQNHCGSAFG